MIFLGVPAKRSAASSGGYIPKGVLTSRVLPAVKGSPMYGWDRYNDRLNQYSSAVKGSV
ncbi:hypothetical protein QJS10_CPB20g02103 [Acorus calamus]|uniref:Uncharacterized protein n=1 Tax=Acorus calamus TaxID=4465 RepID=A0AAV9CB26_ACOCL|nr:hypothetical protein QJS10_CPB20g02103 [Acorus calamus]